MTTPPEHQLVLDHERARARCRCGWRPRSIERAHAAVHQHVTMSWLRAQRTAA